MATKTKKMEIELEPGKFLNYDSSRMENVESSNIQKIGRFYISDKNLKKEIPALVVKFLQKKNPKNVLYVYQGITIETYNQMKGSSSKGEFLNSVIIPTAKETYKITLS